MTQGNPLPDRDPHRGRCWYREYDTQWLSELDWAVYHAPGWQEWQKFRGSLVGTPIDERLENVRVWLRTHGEGRVELVRTVNLLRSLRGYDSVSIELVALRAWINIKLQEAPK